MNKFSPVQIGQTFSRLTVVDLSPIRKNKVKIWICNCKCGKKNCLVKDSALKRSTTKSCGCLKRELDKKKTFSKVPVPRQEKLAFAEVRDLTGEKFGKMVAIKFLIFTAVSPNSPARTAVWQLQCECGNIVERKLSQLCKYRKNANYNCGCVIETKLIGRQFNKLLVVSFAFRKSRRLYWKCQCECGNLINVSTNSLNNKNTRSCGCLAKETFSKMCGPNHYGWNHSLSQEERRELAEHKRRSALPEHVKWRKLVFKRDGHTCQITGKKYDICAHHLESYAHNPDLRYVLDNGITLARVVHELFHKIYGRRKRVTRQQFEEFKIRYESGEWRDYQI